MKYNINRMPPVVTRTLRDASKAQRIKKTVPDSLSTKQYPWLTCVTAAIGGETTAAAKGTTFRFVRTDAQEPAFYNQKDRRIYVDEMRIAATYAKFDWGEFENESIVSSNVSLGTNIETPQGVYVDQWMPLGYLNNVTNTFNRSPQLKGSYTLPVPYYLDLLNPFRLRIRQRFQTVSPGDLEVWFSLFGMGDDGFPIYMIKKLDIPERAVFNPPYYYEVLFDEARDRALRSGVITHIGYGFGPLDPDDVFSKNAAPTTLLSLLELQLKSPTNPSWMREDDWVPLWMLQDQPGMLSSLSSNFLDADYSHMIHKFESPVVLEPKQEITVQLRVLETYDNQFYQTRGFTQDVPIWCAFYGRQEAR